MKQNKGTILRASVDYIKILRRQYDNVTLVGEKCQLLADQNAALQERVKVGVSLFLPGQNMCDVFRGLGTQMFIEWYSYSTVVDELNQQGFACYCCAQFESSETGTFVIVIVAEH